LQTARILWQRSSRIAKLFVVLPTQAEILNTIAENCDSHQAYTTRIKPKYVSDQLKEPKDIKEVREPRQRRILLSIFVLSSKKFRSIWREKKHFALQFVLS
jgi:hypothetical protein